MVAQRAGRPSEDLAVSTLDGAAIMGVILSSQSFWVEHPGSDLFALLDDALARLEEGLTLRVRPAPTNPGRPTPGRGWMVSESR